MDPDSYQIEVLHYLHPHLIWVEVKNYNTRNPVDFVFEQIGIYGLLPQEVSISPDHDGLTTQSSKKWAPAASLVMKKYFANAAEIWFSPTFIDRRASIFDNNIHTFGEISIVKANGKTRSLSERLVKSGFASFEPCRFSEELSVGHIQTKLDKEQTQNVIKQLEKSAQKRPKEKWEKSVKQQTSIHHTAQNIESLFTTENLHRHNLNQDPYNIIEKKIKDLELCKDIEEESVGRAFNPKLFKDNKDNNKNNTVPKKPQSKSRQNTLGILMATKKYLEDNAILKIQDPKDNKKKQFIDENDFPGNTTDECVIQSGLLKKKKAKNSNRVPQVNGDIEKCVAYGPPNFDPMKLCYKVVPKVIEKDTLTEPKSEVYVEIIKERDMYEGVDSVVDLEITRDLLTERKMSPVTSECVKDNSEKDSSLLGSSEPRLLVQSAVIQERLELYKKRHYVSITKGDPSISQTDSSDPKLKVASSEVFQKKVECITRQEFLTKNTDTKNQTDQLEYNTSTDSSIDPRQATRSKLLQKKLESHRKQKEIKTGDTCCTIASSKEYCQISTGSPSELKMSIHSKALQKKLIFYKEKKLRNSDGSTSSTSDIAKNSTSSMEEKKTNDFDSDEESYHEVLEKINQEYPNTVSPKNDMDQTYVSVMNEVDAKNNVNPFKNVDATISVFVDKLVTPVLMVHSKMNKRIQPCYDLRDINFNTHIHVVLRNMSIERPMMIQSISWFTILRGYSLFMVSPLGSGKTIGYLPAVCRLITDFKSETVHSVGPCCIIVCATAKSVTDVEQLCRAFLGLEEKVLSCFTGMNELHITTSLLNGCDLLICTPSMLVRLLQMTNFGVDLRRLSMFVLEDCERLSEVYVNEVKFFVTKINEMLKTRANKELKVQFIAASRIWCDFMEPLAKKAPHSVICVGAFQECVLYSKTSTTVNYVKKDKKIKTVCEFLDEIDGSKKTVIVCRSDNEVEMLEKTLSIQKKVVFACNNTMTVQDLYNLNKTWSDYQEPVSGPILVCCDGNLTHLNVTDAHYLIHFSLPPLFSLFCKRFAVLNDNYPSMFNTENEKVKIKILLDDDNVEQLPKILNFIKRCTDSVPEYLDKICDKVLTEKDALKAKNLVSICDNLLALGECPNFWNCLERHAILKGHDEPKQWMPKNGIVTFNMLHYHTATFYSVRLVSNIVNSKVTEYPQTYSTLCLKLGLHFSKESNRKLHGIPKVGDICAVSVKQNFFVRCKVMKILSHYQNGNPNYVLIKLIDEEKLEKSRDIYLYYLPENLKQIETNVVQLRLANIMPKDKDITFSNLARDELKKITDKENHYMRGHIILTIGNCIFVDTLQACQNLTSLNEIVVREDFKKILLDAHAIPNPDHIEKLENLCLEGNVVIEKVVEVPKPIREQTKPTWAYLDPEGDLTLVVLASTLSPTTFFVRHDKFSTLRRQLWKDIQKYIAENPAPVTDVRIGDIVLAGSVDDGTYERARIDEVCPDGKVKCFFVDEGDYMYVLLKHIVCIPDHFITKMSFQAIECRLIGIEPIGEKWSEFANNWFYDTCERYNNGDCKRFYLKYFTKEISQYTGGHKYGVALIDTSKGYDMLINQFMIEANLADENDEVKYFEELKLCKSPQDDRLIVKDVLDDSTNASKQADVTNAPPKLQIMNQDKEDSNDNIKTIELSKQSKDYELEDKCYDPELEKDDIETPKVPLSMIFPKEEPKSTRRVDKYEFDVADDDEFEIQMDHGIWDMFRQFKRSIGQTTKTKLPALKHTAELDSDDEIKADSIYIGNKIKVTDTLNINDHALENIEVPNFSQSYREIENREFNNDNSDIVKQEVRQQKPDNMVALDSDDLSSECTRISEKPQKNEIFLNSEMTRIKEFSNKTNIKTEPKSVEDLDSDDVSIESINDTELKNTNLNEYRKPTLIWRQTIMSVIIKIILIGVESYKLEIGERLLTFETAVLDEPYGFEFELYGVIDSKNSCHCNKGQYIQVNLRKVIKRTWITLARDIGLKKWIMYDVDSIDLSSDEEVVLKYPLGIATDQKSDSDSDIDVIDDAIL